MLAILAILAQLNPWVRTALVIIFLLIVVVELVRYGPPFRRRGDGVPDAEELNKLLGHTGEVITTMRPVGLCEFDGRKIHCVAESEYLEKGERVRVVRIEGAQPTVRLADKP